jgi:hypothetical protein
MVSFVPLTVLQTVLLDEMRAAYRKMSRSIAPMTFAKNVGIVRRFLPGDSCLDRIFANAGATTCGWVLNSSKNFTTTMKTDFLHQTIAIYPKKT